MYMHIGSRFALFRPFRNPYVDTTAWVLRHNGIAQKRHIWLQNVMHIMNDHRHTPLRVVLSLILQYPTETKPIGVWNAAAPPAAYHHHTYIESSKYRGICAGLALEAASKDQGRSFG